MGRFWGLTVNSRPKTRVLQAKRCSSRALSPARPARAHLLPRLPSSVWFRTAAKHRVAVETRIEVCAAPSEAKLVQVAPRSSPKPAWSGWWSATRCASHFSAFRRLHVTGGRRQDAGLPLDCCDDTAPSGQSLEVVQLGRQLAAAPVRRAVARLVLERSLQPSAHSSTQRARRASAVFPLRARA